MKQLNQNNMSTSIYISRIITRIQTENGRASVTNHRINEFGSIICGLKSFEFSGTIQEMKFNKLQMQIMNAGFKVENVVCNEPIFDNGLMFNIVYKRCN